MSLPEYDCLEYGESPCEGEVFERVIPGASMAFPRCDRHYEERSQERAPRIARVRRT